MNGGIFNATGFVKALIVLRNADMTTISYEEFEIIKRKIIIILPLKMKNVTFVRSLYSNGSSEHTICILYQQKKWNKAFEPAINTILRVNNIEVVKKVLENSKMYVITIQNKSI